MLLPAAETSSSYSNRNHGRPLFMDHFSNTSLILLLNIANAGRFIQILGFVPCTLEIMKY